MVSKSLVESVKLTASRYYVFVLVRSRHLRVLQLHAANHRATIATPLPHPHDSLLAWCRPARQGVSGLAQGFSWLPRLGNHRERVHSSDISALDAVH